MNRRREFIAGLISPSIGAVGVGCLLAFSVLLAGEMLSRNKFFDLFPADYVRLDPGDGWTASAYKVHGFTPQTGKPAIILLGASSLREAMFRQEILQRDLASASVPLKALKLTSSAQTIFESLAVVESLPDGEGLLVVSVNPARLSSSFEQVQKYVEQYTFFPPGSELRRVSGLPTREYPSHLAGWIRHSIVLWRAGRLKLKGGPIAEEEHFYDALERPSPEEFERQSKDLTETGIPRFVVNNPDSIAALTTAVRLAKRKGYVPIILDTPLSPTARRLYEPIWGVYRSQLLSLAQNNGALYWDFAWSLNLSDDDFYDFAHLLPPGRRRYHNAFVNAVATEWQRNGKARRP